MINLNIGKSRNLKSGVTMEANAHGVLNRPRRRPMTPNRVSNRGPARWAIVLAGGDVKRMRPLINHWLSEDRPKQYCAFVGSRSMLQHTIDRARSVVSGKHIVTIIGQGHRAFLRESGDEHVPGVVLEQPGNLGTAPGIFLPTAYVLAENPEATVLFLPSDHFIYPEDRFCEHMTHSMALAEKYPDQIILVGAIPDRTETDYGWIEPGKMRADRSSSLTQEPMSVLRFREKPSSAEADVFLRRGYLWNTMVMAVKAKTLWALGRQCLPEMMSDFALFLMVLRAVREGRLNPAFEAGALAKLYNNVAPADFSKDILEHVYERSLILPLDGVSWCDWGRPQRVTETLASLGRRPLFPMHFLESDMEPGALANECRI
jgi:mannose-1-phosphate guanylyltransferase